MAISEAFTSNANNLAESDTNGRSDIFLLDTHDIRLHSLSFEDSSRFIINGCKSN
jgi:hypothetical protein